MAEAKKRRETEQKYVSIGEVKERPFIQRLNQVRAQSQPGKKRKMRNSVSHTVHDLGKQPIKPTTHLTGQNGRTAVAYLCRR